MACVFPNVVRTHRKSLSTGQHPVKTQSISEDVGLLSSHEHIHRGLSSLWAWANPSLWSRRDWDSCSPSTWIPWLPWLSVCDRDLWESSLPLSPCKEGSLACSLSACGKWYFYTYQQRITISTPSWTPLIWLSGGKCLLKWNYVPLIISAARAAY